MKRSTHLSARLLLSGSERQPGWAVVSADSESRWLALNHAVAVNRFLGFEDRVAMTNRHGHEPTAESSEQIYRFFQYFLQ